MSSPKHKEERRIRNQESALNTSNGVAWAVGMGTYIYDLTLTKNVILQRIHTFMLFTILGDLRIFHCKAIQQKYNNKVTNNITCNCNTLSSPFKTSYDDVSYLFDFDVSYELQTMRLHFVACKNDNVRKWTFAKY